MTAITVSRTIQVDIDLSLFISRFPLEELQDEINLRLRTKGYPKAMKRLLAAWNKGLLSHTQVEAIEQAIDQVLGVDTWSCGIISGVS